MEFIDFQSLVQQTTKNKKYFVTAEARDLGNKLIFEYGITADHDLASILKVSTRLNGQRAVRVWAQKQLPLIDEDETDDERYRQLRHLFQKAIPNFM